MQQVQQLPMWKKWMYALGQFGWSLAGFAVGSKLVYFYLPPAAIKMGPFVVQGNVLPLISANGVVLFGLTIIGLVFAFGRLFDAVTDPLVAGLSDRCTMKLGKRRSFLALSVLPFALMSALVFFPLTTGISSANTVWLFVSVFLFYWFMTMYVTPFFALLPELGHSPDERLQLSTMISITWALGTMVGSQIEAFQRLLINTGMDATRAFQAVVSIFAVVSFAFMLLPIIFIDERKYCDTAVSKGSILKSIVSVFKNRNFLRFTFSDLAYWVSITIINTVLVYYVVDLLKLETEFTSLLIMVMFLLSFVFYIPVNLIGKKVGKKLLLCVAFVWFFVVFLYSAFLGYYPFAPKVQGLITVILASVPIAIFGIVQNAILGDIAEADGIETGVFQSGIFYGARTFMSKLGQSLAGFIIPSLLILGADFSKASGDVTAVVAVTGEMGVRLTAVVAAVFCLIGFFLFLLYSEKDIMRSLAKREALGKAR